MSKIVQQPPVSETTAANCVRAALPQLNAEQAADLARIVDVLVDRFAPDRVYVFGSYARGTANRCSDIDLLVVVPDAGEYPHRLDQEGLGVIGRHLLPMDLLFMGRDEFEWRSRVVTSLPTTVSEEGRILYGKSTE